MFLGIPWVSPILEAIQMTLLTSIVSIKILVSLFEIENNAPREYNSIYVWVHTRKHAHLLLSSYRVYHMNQRGPLWVLEEDMISVSLPL